MIAGIKMQTEFEISNFRNKLKWRNKIVRFFFTAIMFSVLKIALHSIAWQASKLKSRRKMDGQMIFHDRSVSEMIDQMHCCSNRIRNWLLFRRFIELCINLVTRRFDNYDDQYFLLKSPEPLYRWNLINRVHPSTDTSLSLFHNSLDLSPILLS